MLYFSPLIPDSLHLDRLLLVLSLKSLVLDLDVIVLSLKVLLPLTLSVCALSALKKFIILILVKCDFHAILCLLVKSEAALLVKELVQGLNLLLKCVVSLDSESFVVLSSDQTGLQLSDLRLLSLNRLPRFFAVRQSIFGLGLNPCKFSFKVQQPFGLGADL